MKLRAYYKIVRESCAFSCTGEANIVDMESGRLRCSGPSRVDSPTVGNARL